MNQRRIFALLGTGLLLIPLASSSPVRADRSQSKLKSPPLILWAWERPEDLTFIHSKNIGVAYLAGTIRFRESRIAFYPRQQPLQVPSDMSLVAVIRIETTNAALDANQLREVERRVLEVSRLPNVAGVQIDFDARRSEREFYRELVVALHSRLPVSKAISITALSSWCIGDDWISGLPIDEAVPMLFRMGTGTNEVTSWFGSERDFREPLCQNSVGISLDEPWKRLPLGRRVYAFSPKPWTEESLEALYWEMDKWR